MSIHILHLSDIHAGTGEFLDQDSKDYLPESDRERMLDRLSRYLESLPDKPTYLILSGDITLRGSPTGLVAVRSWLLSAIEKHILPPPKRIIVTPGNHDPIRGVAEGVHRDRKRYESFYTNYGRTFPHSHIPGWDPKLDTSNLNFRSRNRHFGGVSTRERFGDVQVVSNHPFILDLERDILIFAFNSSLACGVHINPPYFVPLNDYLNQQRSESPSTRLENLLRELKDSTLVDAGLIGTEQLAYFALLMTKMRKELGDRWANLTKIAVLHHHISHLWNQQLELKRFEAVVDAAQLKQYLIEYQFDLVLHGHKHTNNVSLDGSLIPVSDKSTYSPLCIISGGTVGGIPRTGDTQSFKLIELKGNVGPRNQATVREVPLRDTASPSDVIGKYSRFYQVPLAAKLPELHDNHELKEALDNILANKLAPELFRKNSYIISVGETQLPSGVPEIVSNKINYRFYRSAENSSEIVYYELLLATEELNFRQRSRIHWMLTDVRASRRDSILNCRVVLLIGDLSKTGLFQGRLPDEVKKSIATLKNWFGPAIKSGLLEVRAHQFSPRQVREGFGLSA
jgi:3',5'-cyclic AMP phosphodiesterase CpdA